MANAAWANSAVVVESKHAEPDWEALSKHRQCCLYGPAFSADNSRKSSLKAHKLPSFESWHHYKLVLLSVPQYPPL